MWWSVCSGTGWLFAEAGRCSLSLCPLCCFIVLWSIDFHFLFLRFVIYSPIQLVMHTLGESNFSLIHASSYNCETISCRVPWFFGVFFCYQALWTREWFSTKRPEQIHAPHPCMVTPSFVLSPRVRRRAAACSARRNTKQPYSEVMHRSMLRWLHRTNYTKQEVGFVHL